MKEQIFLYFGTALFRVPASGAKLTVDFQMELSGGFFWIGKPGTEICVPWMVVSHESH